MCFGFRGLAFRVCVQVGLRRGLSLSSLRWSCAAGGGGGGGASGGT